MKENIFWRVTALALAVALGFTLALLYVQTKRPASTEIISLQASEDEPEATKKEATPGEIASDQPSEKITEAELRRRYLASRGIKEGEIEETVDDLAMSWLLKENKRYPYLPERYSQPYIFTKGEWAAYRLDLSMARGVIPPERLSTEQFVVEGHSFLLLPTAPTFLVFVKCQPGWRHYIGKGVFDVPDKILRAAVNKLASNYTAGMPPEKIAGKESFGLVSELKEADILVTLVSETDNAVIAWYKNGKVMLAGEDEWH